MLAGGSAAEQGRDDGLVADEGDVGLGMRQRVGEDARHDLGRSEVTAHGVDRDPDPSLARDRPDRAQVHVFSIIGVLIPASRVGVPPRSPVHRQVRRTCARRSSA